MPFYRDLVRRVARRLNCSGLYETHYGIKSYNQLVSSERLALFVTGSALHLPAASLYIGFDGLRDSVTLLDTPLTDSPHLELARILDNGRTPETSEYVHRVREGTLDFRPARKVASAYLKRLAEAYHHTRREAETGQQSDVKVFRIGGRYYIADGKHRAAVCHLIQQTVRCRDVTLAICDSFYYWVYRKMRLRPSQYSKHLQWLDCAYRQQLSQDPPLST